MGNEFLNWQELAAEHKKLKADHDALRKLVDKMADAIENHIHGQTSIWQTTKPLKIASSTPQPKPVPTSSRTRGPEAQAGE